MLVTEINRLLIVQVGFTDAGTNRVASTLICSPAVTVQLSWRQASNVHFEAPP